ncbi:cold shock domain-containing protein [Rhodobacteraceae bacterium S2214]|nr:cold shock domain-containing protein [Rhodobacteraceae bacterium S2214]
MNTIVNDIEVADGGRVEGTVKWFDCIKGYGFICVPGVQGDILLHLNVLLQVNRSSISEGATVLCKVSGEAGRLRATEVYGVHPVEQFEQSTLTFQPARVRWFSKSKGYGFAVVFGTTEDIFVGQESMKSSGFGSLEAGEAISIVVERRKDGLAAVKVAAWQ